MQLAGFILVLGFGSRAEAVLLTVSGERSDCQSRQGIVAATCAFEMNPAGEAQVLFLPPGRFAEEDPGLAFVGLNRPREFPVGSDGDPRVVGTIRYHNFDIEVVPPERVDLTMTFEHEGLGFSIPVSFVMAHSPSIDLRDPTAEEFERAKPFCSLPEDRIAQIATLCDDLLMVEGPLPHTIEQQGFVLELVGFDLDHPTVLNSGQALLPEGTTTEIDLRARVVALAEPSGGIFLLCACAMLALFARRLGT